MMLYYLHIYIVAKYNDDKSWNPVEFVFLIELPGAKSSIIFNRRIAIVFIVLSAAELQSSFWLTSLME